MGEAKIEIRVGKIQFTGQGEQEWVTKQLDKILSRAEELLKLAPPSEEEGGGESKPMGADKAIAKKPLGAFLREKGAATSQVKKFLATAVWAESKGKNRLTTSDITRALRESNQTRLANPSVCLSNNVSKGYIEKDGKEFFVTQEGKESL